MSGASTEIRSSDLDELSMIKPCGGAAKMEIPVKNPKALNARGADSRGVARSCEGLDFFAWEVKEWAAKVRIPGLHGEAS
jgi:hypothetical protein